MSEANYRIEVSPNNRAGCKANTECKTSGEKIQKGEIRFGTLVEIKGHTSWVWRHWGCVTPKILENLHSQCGDDMSLVDGYEELPEEIQEKVKRGIQQEHVDDEDWRGDPEYNRPGMNGFRARGSKKKADKGNEDGAPAPKKRGRKPKQDADEEVTEEAPPSKKRKAKAKPTADDDEEEEKAEDEPKPKKARGRKPKAKEASDDEAELEPEKPVKAKAGRKKAKPEPEPEPESESEEAEVEEPESEPESEPEEKPKKRGRKPAAAKASSKPPKRSKK